MADFRHKSPMDAMIDNASSHLQSPPETNSIVHPVRETHPTTDDRDEQHMENFPLVPLEVIPRMSTARLQECRAELFKLADTLTNDPDEVVLGHYIKKQLATVVTELEDRRAKQRIADLIAGNPVLPSPPVFFAASPASRSKSVQNIRTPAKPAVAAQPPNHALPPPQHPQPAKLSLREMKSLARATKVTSSSDGAKFIIQGNNVSKKNKKKRKAVAKPPPVVSPEDIIKKQREERRRLAHERLLARQAKIALKKQQAMEKKKAAATLAAASESGKDDSSESDCDVVDKAPSSSDEYVDDAVPETKEGERAQSPPKPERVATGPIIDDERISRINAQLCLIQAEDNLRVLKSRQREKSPPTTPRGMPPPNQESVNAKSESLTQTQKGWPDLFNQAKEDAVVTTEAVDQQTGLPPHKVNDRDDHPLPEEATPNAPEDGDEEDDDDNNEGSDSDDDEDAAPAPPEPTYDMASFHTKTYLVVKDDTPATAATTPRDSRSLPEWFQDQRNFIHHITKEPSDVQQSPPNATLARLAPVEAPVVSTSPPTPRDDPITTNDSLGAEQARKIMSNLLRDRSNIKSCQVSVDTALHSLSIPSAQPVDVTKPDTSVAKKTQRPRSCTPFSGPPKPKPEAAASTDAPRAFRNPRPTAKGSPSPAMPLLKMPGKAITDYSSVYRNFYCIMTSFFERMKTAQESGVAPHKAQAKDIIQNGDVAIRFQLKLYTVWKNVMHDYATVFGVEGLLKTTREFDSSCVYDGKCTPYTAQFRINSQARQEVVGIVVEALKKLPDWDELPVDLGLNTTWNLLWTWSKPRVDRQSLLAWQKVNHFAGAKALTRKDMLKKSLQRYTAMGDKVRSSFDIAPETFILPNDYIPFVQAFKRRADAIGSTKNFWIMKPVALSRGRGISLLNDLGQVAYGEAVIVQKYIENPLLLDGFKFDLRLYVLVTSFNPLEAFFYNEGFVRICTHRYTTDSSDIGDLFMHLTNSSIQKHGNMDQVPDNPVNNAETTEAGGTKASLAYLWSRLAAAKAPVDEIKAAILEVIVKSLVAGEDSIPYQVNSFDLYGYDILLDDQYRPWLIEINSSPSMARENNLDYVIKDALLYDTIRLVNPLHFDRAALVAVLKRRADELAQDKKRPNLLHPVEAEARAAHQLNEDLTDILRGQVPRQYGEVPEHMGNFQRIAPSAIHTQVMKIKRSCFRDSPAVKR